MKRIVSLFCLMLLTSLFILPLRLQAVEYKYPGNNKVLFYAPGFDTFDDRQNEIADPEFGGPFYFAEAAYFDAIITSKLNTSASVEQVKQFSNYGTVIMQTHGWWWELEGIGPFPAFRTGTVALNSVDDDKYFDDLLSRRLVISKKPNTVGIYHYVVMPSFIEKYIPATMPDTFMYLGYCSSMHNNTMWNAFKEKGAKVAFGWSKHIKRSTNVDFFVELMEEKMLPKSKDIAPLTAGEALAAIPEEEDLTWDDHENGHIILKTASSEWENFVFLDTMMLVDPFVMTFTDPPLNEKLNCESILYMVDANSDRTTKPVSYLNKTTVSNSKVICHENHEFTHYIKGESAYSVRAMMDYSCKGGSAVHAASLKDNNMRLKTSNYSGSGEAVISQTWDEYRDNVNEHSEYSYDVILGTDVLFNVTHDITTTPYTINIRGKSAAFLFLDMDKQIAIWVELEWDGTYSNLQGIEIQSQLKLYNKGQFFTLEESTFHTYRNPNMAQSNIYYGCPDDECGTFCPAWKEVPGTCGWSMSYETCLRKTGYIVLSGSPWDNYFPNYFDGYEDFGISTKPFEVNFYSIHGLSIDYEKLCTTRVSDDGKDLFIEIKSLADPRNISHAISIKEGKVSISIL